MLKQLPQVKKVLKKTKYNIEHISPVICIFFHHTGLFKDMGKTEMGKVGGVPWLIKTATFPPELTLDRYVKKIHTSKASCNP